MSRTTLRPKLVITSGSMAASITSTATVMQSLLGVGYGLSWTGTSPVGTASVEVSNDYSLNPNGTVKNSGTWTPLELFVGGSAVTSIAITGDTGTAFIDVQQTMAYAVRLIYTRTSGTGTLNATVNGKVS